MKDYICEHSLLLIFFCWCFVLTNAGVKDERGRQTFVVRYKHGEQTIPVTVVLDYKKQTEYVINMNPRSPAKSVTLYDFKQRTIAFKDLTNRECFLGHLTYETLNHERESLHEVKSPVERDPKVLSLDPRKPALTPTEIRNIAGQKTAVFCRKMNTWLLMPDVVHNVKKRETEEVEERTYGHHGYHTVQYSHYGHETIRRFRNPSRSLSRQQHQRRQNAVGNENLKPTVSDEIPAYERHVIPRRTSHGFQPSGSENINHHPTPESANNSSYIRKKSFPEASSNILSATSPVNPRNGNHSSHKSTLHHQKSSSFPNNAQSSTNGSPNLNSHFGYRIRSPTNFEAEFSSSFGDKSHFSNILGPTFHPHIDLKSHKNHNLDSAPELDKKPAALTNQLIEVPQKRIEQGSTTESSRLVKRTERDSSEAAIPTLAYWPEDNRKIYNLSEPSSWLPVPDEQRRLSLSRLQNLGGHGTRNIETESFSEEILPSLGNNAAKEPLTNFVEIARPSVDPDVSINVLEIPKLTSKFEALKTDENSLLFAKHGEQEKSNIRVGGLFDSLGNHPVLEHDYVFNPYYPVSENSQDRSNLIYPDTLNTKSSQNLLLNNGKITKYLNENQPRFSNPVNPTHPTQLPAFTTPTFDGLKPEPTSNYLHSLTFSVHKPENSQFYKPGVSFSLSNPVQGRNFNKYKSSGSDASIDNFAVQGNTFSDENFLGIIPRTFLTTETYPLVHETNSNLRSDIPSEDKRNDNHLDTASFSSANNNISRNFVPLQVSNLTTDKHTLANHLRFQNVLRQFKPDEIIIDVAQIPTQPPPDTTPEFSREGITTTYAPPRRIITTQTPFRSITTTHSPLRSITTFQTPLRSSYKNRNIADRRSEQVSGITYRSSYAQPTKQPKRRVNDHPQHQIPQGVTFHVRKDASFHHRHFNTSQQNIHTQTVNRNRQHASLPKTSPGFNVAPHFSQPFRQQPRFSSPRQINRQHAQSINILPPGVSVHPRHPQSPFADMIHSNRPPSLPQGTNHRISQKPHRQRHHRKKDRFSNSCCGGTGKSNDLMSCCRSGGQCCSGLRNGAHQQSRVPCCSSDKIIPNRQVQTRNQNEPRVRNNIRSQQTTKVFVDNRDRCQKAKMCRTLYESTQQVMVCRKADIEGC